MSREMVARVVGQAMIDKTFADSLAKDPAKAAASIGVHLGPAETTAMKDIDVAKLDSVANVIRGKLGISAVLDQQQQQARMD
jgi:hypothetical protein